MDLPPIIVLTVLLASLALMLAWLLAEAHPDDRRRLRPLIVWAGGALFVLDALGLVASFLANR
jgi:hypothetical protein